MEPVRVDSAGQAQPFGRAKFPQRDKELFRRSWDPCEYRQIKEVTRKGCHLAGQTKRYHI